MPEGNSPLEVDLLLNERNNDNACTQLRLYDRVRGAVRRESSVLYQQMTPLKEWTMETIIKYNEGSFIVNEFTYQSINYF